MFLLSVNINTIRKKKKTQQIVVLKKRELRVKTSSKIGNQMYILIMLWQIVAKSEEGSSIIKY